MSCKLCNSENQGSFPSEINIHFSGLENLTKPTVWAFPELLICLDCGFAETNIEERELRLLADSLENRAYGQSSVQFKLGLPRVA